MSWKDWPVYDAECRRDMTDLLAVGGSLSAYRANVEYGLGPSAESWVGRAERLAEEIHGVKHVIMCSSGTLALEALAMVLYPRDHPDICVPAFTFSATISALMSAVTPAFEDVDEYGLLVDTGDESWPVDLFGKQVDWATVADSCQAVGILPVAQHGAWSFSTGKQVPAGEGGAVYTDSPQVAAAVRMWLGHGENFGATHPGTNGYMSEPTGVLVYHGLMRVRERLQLRWKWASLLNTILHEARPESVEWTPDLTDHALYRYPLVLPHSMPQVAKRLQAAGVDCQPGYIQPTLEVYPAFRHLQRGDLTTTHALSRDRLLLFPQVNPCATESEITQLGEQIVQAGAAEGVI